MPFLQLNENNLYYEIHGRGEPLVLVAGLTCDLNFWSGILDELKALPNFDFR
ncbi:MAG: hypothetical protein HWD61_03420 [Parachlamydiaceae bacterium]|nr:MAG: hypothetical protein HWD61_03420 [Parachlamydiaceae bacterium]